MVTGKDYTMRLADSNPTGSFQSLSRFVDEQRTELHTRQQTIGRPGKGACYHLGIIEKSLVDGEFHLSGTSLETGDFLMHVIAVSATRFVQLTYGATHSPQVLIQGMSLETTFVGEAQHLVRDACGIAYTQHTYAAVHQLLRNPVHSHVRLGAYQHLILASQGLVYGFHQGRRLACSRRSVNHSHILCPQHFVYGSLLRRVEPGEADRVKGEFLCRQRAMEDFAQFSQTTRLGADNIVQSFEHQPVRLFVEV